MQKEIAGVTEDQLLEWVRESVHQRRNILSHGYQGYTYVFDTGGKRLVVKAPMGGALSRFVRTRMLLNEYKVYTRLAGMSGIPACYGFVGGKYLVLEHVPGKPIREAPVEDSPQFFDALFRRIQAMHQRGVAHGDLKRKDNILVVDGSHPYLIDFGVAVIRKKGFAPFNRYLFGLFKRWDFNAWLKLKYDGAFQRASARDLQYYHRTAVEHIAGWIKRRYRAVKKIWIGHD